MPLVGCSLVSSAAARSPVLLPSPHFDFSGIIPPMVLASIYILTTPNLYHEPYRFSTFWTHPASGLLNLPTSVFHQLLPLDLSQRGPLPCSLSWTMATCFPLVSSSDSLSSVSLSNEV